MLKTFRTTNITVHLSVKHPEMYREFEKFVVFKEAKKALEKSGESRASQHQLSLMQCEDQIHHWGIIDVHAHRIHRRIREMIALDACPFSIMENQWFTCLIK